MAAVVCCGLLGLAGSAYAVPSNGMIAYVGDGGLQVMRADGTDSRPLFAAPGGRSWPRFSPMGTPCSI